MSANTKRGLEHNEAQYGREKLFRRQEPVSCEFCRRKKLKCDRGAPCSNCRARKLNCSSVTGDDVYHVSLEGTHSTTTEKPLEPDQAAPAVQNIDDLNDRVKKLEVLLAQSQPLTSVVNIRDKPSAYHLVAPPANQTSGEIEYNKAVSWLETDAFEHQPTSDENPTVVPCSAIADSFGSFIFSLTRPRIAPALSQHFFTMLPARPRAKIMFEYYIDHLNWIYHIVHIPTVENHLGELYDKLEQGRQPDYDVLALISTLFALCAYFSAPSTNLFDSHADAMLHCHRWTMLAQDALSAADCLAKPTIESLQSLILIAQHLMPNIGAVATLRTLSGTITHAARLLCIHQTDSPTNKKRRQNSQVNWIEIETKRRLWWHITSTDWIMSFMSGSQCGTYTIHPQQMNCDWPTNVDDVAITVAGNYGQPLTILTDMTYFILRIRFSVVFRNIVDAAWQSGSDLDDLPYEIVLECDRHLSDLLAELELSFNTVNKHKPKGAALDPITERKFTLLTRQRDMGLFGVHTRISRLHRSFLIRGAQDPRYAYSRMVCLRSARTVIEIGKQMLQCQNKMSGLVSIKIWTLNHHLFVSIVILVMDYCFNREEPRAKERKEEILECFRLLDGTAGQHTIAGRGLQKLKEMLRKTPGDGDDSPSSRPGSENSIREAPPSTSKSNMHTTTMLTSAAQGQNQNLTYQQLIPEQSSAPRNQNLNFAPPAEVEQPPPYQQWTNWDNSLYDFNFDINFDASQFEALFRFEGSENF